MALLACAGALFAADAKSAPAAKSLSLNYEIPLWEEGHVPLAAGDGPLDKPFLTVFRPPKGKRNSGSVVVAPGGGNIMLMYGVEGMEIAERYNEWGVTAFVLTYRLSPRYRDDARMLDAQARHAGGAQPGVAVSARSREGRVYRVFGGLDAGTPAGGRGRPRRSERRGSGRPAQFAAGLSRAGVRSGPGHSGRAAEELPADISAERAGGHRQRGRIGAVVRRTDARRSHGRNPRLPEGTARLRQRASRRRSIPTGWAGCSGFSNTADSSREAN